MYTSHIYIILSILLLSSIFYEYRKFRGCDLSSENQGFLRAIRTTERATKRRGFIVWGWACAVVGWGCC